MASRFGKAKAIEKIQTFISEEMNALILDFDQVSQQLEHYSHAYSMLILTFTMAFMPMAAMFLFTTFFAPISLPEVVHNFVVGGYMFMIYPFSIMMAMTNHEIKSCASPIFSVMAHQSTLLKSAQWSEALIKGKLRLLICLESITDEHQFKFMLGPITTISSSLILRVSITCLWIGASKFISSSSIAVQHRVLVKFFAIRPRGRLILPLFASNFIDRFALPPHQPRSHSRIRL